MICAGAFAGDLAFKTEKQSPPESVAPPIRKSLSDHVIRLSRDDKPVYEIWLVKSVPVKRVPADSSDSLGALRETTLLGVIAVNAAERDYRDDGIESGIYTMRFALKPQDGNHLGTSVHPYFCVLTRIARDSSPSALGSYNKLVDASSIDTATDHPVILSLFPVDKPDSPLPSLHAPAEDHKAVRVGIPAVPGDPDTARDGLMVVFDLVYEGTGEL